MEKTILFGILEQYADWEAAYLSSAITMLSGGAFSIKTISVRREPVTSIGGFRVLPDYDLETVPAEYAALILIGGMTWRSEPAKAFAPLARDCHRRGKVLGGICDAAAFLGTAGLLNGVRHTANDLEDLKQWAGSAYTGAAKFIPKQAVRDGAIITANGTAPLEFAKEVLLALDAAPASKISAWYDFHKLGYYCAPMPKDI